MAGYSGTPLPKKLGIAAGSRTAVLNAPADVAAILGPLPDGAVLEPAIGPGCDLALWFTSERTALEAEIARHAAAVPGRGLWILWPKKSSGVGSNLTEAIVRSCGLAAGLVDYKVCSVNEVWSGLRFTRRKP
ncbi:MAG: DUF3052 domain-containing protein [Candidatus Schekmanbacteria bacterium]|nr:DUF3052 domain-containing protein [Candidatus Schekmanbacteria bacterium]